MREREKKRRASDVMFAAMRERRGPHLMFATMRERRDPDLMFATMLFLRKAFIHDLEVVVDGSLVWGLAGETITGTVACFSCLR